MRAVPFSGYQVVSRQVGLLAKCSILELIIFSISGDSKKNLPGGGGGLRLCDDHHPKLPLF